jgi:tetraacyldisaccharide 4'-kinase
MRAPDFYFRPPGLGATLLAPFGAVYGAVAAARMRMSGTRAGAPVICVGNPTLGGAGKTPTALAIGRLLAAMGERPFFLSRGYGGTESGPLRVDPKQHRARDVGDEPLLLARDQPTVVARDRVAGAALAVAEGASVLVLDDGFQSPALAKDLSLLVVDGTSGAGNGAVFPAGPLRAPLDAQLSLAHAVVQVGEGPGSGIARRASGRGVPVLLARLVPEGGNPGRKLLAFAGIGRPEKFFATLQEGGAEVAETRAFADHHRYTGAEADALLAAANAKRLTLITTEKDFARMHGEPSLAKLVAATRTLPVRLEFEDDGAIRNMLEKTLAAARGARR